MWNHRAGGMFPPAFAISMPLRVLCMAEVSNLHKQDVFHLQNR